MLRMFKPIFRSWKDVVLDSRFVFNTVITYIKSKGVIEASLINNHSYFPKGVPGDLIDTHFEDK